MKVFLIYHIIRSLSTYFEITILHFSLFLLGELNDLILKAIMPQLATGTKKLASIYGEILYHAWKECHIAAKEINGVTNADIIGRGQQFQHTPAMVALEETLQSIVRDAIHTADPKLFKGLRFMLLAFHQVKRVDGFDSLLFRIYGPMLWRFLKCANAIIRCQTALIFFDVFPLHDSAASAEEDDQIMQKQFDLLSALLKDGDHRVRAHAAAGVCHVLQEYWDLLPKSTALQLLRYVLFTLGFDASSMQVRFSVYSGMLGLFDQPLAVDVLKNLLKTKALSPSINDTAERVRVAFIKILCQVNRSLVYHYFFTLPVL